MHVEALRRWAGAAVLVVLLFSLGAGTAGARPAALSQAAAPTPERPVACFVLFYGETCPHCHEVMDNFLPGVYGKYGDQVEYQYIEVYNSPENRLLMLRLLAKLGIPPEEQGGVPALVIGDKVLVGSVDIPGQLESMIDQYLAQGGVDYPSFENLPEVILPTPAPAVEVLVIFRQTHPDFASLNSLIMSLAQEYGDGLRAYALDLDQEGTGETVSALNKALGVADPAAGTPEVLVGERMLVGLPEISQSLPGLVGQHLQTGGLPLPDLQSLIAAATPTPPEAGPTPSAPSPTAAAQPTTAVPTQEAKTIHILYFFKSGCSDCDRVGLDLRFIEQTYPQVRIVHKEIDEEQALAEWMGQQQGVPEEQRLAAPALYIGADYLADDTLALPTLQATVEKYVATGTDPIWARFGAQEEQEARARLAERYRSLGVLSVLGAGIVNGLNPCTLVTIIFFLSYLTFVGRRDLLLIGACFVAGVFSSYFLAGLGLYKLLEPLAGVQAALKLWVYGLTAVLCLALAAVSVHDFVKARQGKHDQMKLKLSLDLRRQVNRVIRQGTQMRALYLTAFGVGVLVSLIQLTCTSPIYLGILFAMNDVPEMRANAVLYLLLYNLANIVPLLFVLGGATVFAVSLRALGALITRLTAAIKLVTAVVFLVLFGWVLYALLNMAGVV